MIILSPLLFCLSVKTQLKCHLPHEAFPKTLHNSLLSYFLLNFVSLFCVFILICLKGNSMVAFELYRSTFLDFSEPQFFFPFSGLGNFDDQEFL